jgi:uridine kinase
VAVNVGRVCFSARADRRFSARRVEKPCAAPWRSTPDEEAGMPLGDILVITDDHKKAAQEITDLVLSSHGSERVSLAIGAESGAGKSEISHTVAKSLFQSEQRLKSFIIHTDDFFVLPHKERNELRHTSNLECVGPSEIDFDELNYVLKRFQSGGQILIPILEFITSSAYKLLVDFRDVQVLICEGLYAPMLDVTHKMFIDMTYHDTMEFQAKRGKEVADEFRLRVLEKEHQAVSTLRTEVDHLITKDYSLAKQ